MFHCDCESTKREASMSRTTEVITLYHCARSYFNTAQKNIAWRYARPGTTYMIGSLLVGYTEHKTSQARWGDEGCHVHDASKISALGLQRLGRLHVAGDHDPSHEDVWLEYHGRDCDFAFLLFVRERRDQRGIHAVRPIKPQRSSIQ